jgi:hypothetical protein
MEEACYFSSILRIVIDPVRSSILILLFRFILSLIPFGLLSASFPSSVKLGEQREKSL